MTSSWKSTTLGELGRYLNGRGFKKSEWATSGRPIIRIQNLTGSSTEFNYFDGQADERHVAHPGDLLVSWAATLGAYIWNGPEAVVNQHIFKVESTIDRMFHKYLLDFKLDELMSHTHGSGMVHITRPQFDGLPVSVPELDEQRRIVELVEEHLSHLDAADAALQRVNDRAVALLTSAQRSQLWGLPQRVPFDQIFALVRPPAATVPERDYQATGAHLVIDQGAPRAAFTDQDDAVYHGPLPVLVFGDHTRRAKYLDHPFAVGAQGVKILKPLVNARFAYWCLATAPIESRGYGRHYARLRQCSFPLADAASQRTIAGDLDLLQTNTDRVRQATAQAAARSAALRRAVLTAAFSGRLTGHASDAEVIEETAESLA